MSASQRYSGVRALAKPSNQRALSRRQALMTVSVGLSAVACSTTLERSSVGGMGGSGAPGVGGNAPQDCSAAAADWAGGGTAAMTAKHCYPNPFSAVAISCAMICETTEGPCTSATVEREDVSEGFGGLPVRLLLRVVDPSCAPLVGAIVQIWHTQLTGVYSGVTPGGPMCHGSDTAAEQALYFRGVQTTDGAGVVAFDTCFPGWYPGRAVHIHFEVRIGDEHYATSQLFFDDAVVSDVFASHPEYSGYGAPDTSNDGDSILGDASDKSGYLLDVERMPDGAMLASKTIVVQSGGPGCFISGGGLAGGG